MQTTIQRQLALKALVKRNLAAAVTFGRPRPPVIGLFAGKLGDPLIVWCAVEGGWLPNGYSVVRRLVDQRASRESIMLYGRPPETMLLLANARRGSGLQDSTRPRTVG